MTKHFESNQNHIIRISYLGLYLATIVLVSVGFFGCRNTTKTQEDFNIRAVFKNNANYLIYFVAKEKGFFREAGVSVQETEIESTNLMIQALSSGQADFNPSTSVPALYAAEQNAPGTFKFLFTTLMEKGRTNDAIIVRKDSPFKSLADLKGKKIGCPPGITSIILLKLIFADIGIDTKTDITIQELEPRAQLQVLAADQVHAVFAIEPIITLGEEKGISRILESEPMENHIMNPIPIAGGIITASFAKSHPKTVQRLQEVMEHSIDFIRQQEDEARSIMARAIGMPDGTAKRLGINSYWKNNETNNDFVQRLADLFLQYGALQKPVNTRLMYQSSLQ